MFNFDIFDTFGDPFGDLEGGDTIEILGDVLGSEVVSDNCGDLVPRSMTCGTSFGVPGNLGETGSISLLGEGVIRPLKQPLRIDSLLSVYHCSSGPRYSDNFKFLILFSLASSALLLSPTTMLSL